MTFLAGTYWAGAPFQFRRPPSDANVESLVLRTADARDIRALYWTPRATPRPRTAVVAMHPRVDFTHHYSFPRLVAAGIGCLGALSRNPNNDMDTEHEALVLDLAACVSFLRHQRDVETLILLGNSGGGSLAGLYQAQARLAPAARIARSPGGTRTFLPEAELLPADALMLVTAHRGQGAVLAACIDPSVIDESQPLLTDPSLDMYSTQNGFRPPPEWSEYPDEFVARYRAAQRARVHRLDCLARALIEEGRAARGATRAKGFDALPIEERQRVERRADFTPIMTIHRTMANLDYTDRRLDPSGRDYGSLLSDRPDRMNFELMGFARVCTPRAWLSTWSALSTNADLVRNLPGVREPVLVVHAGRDREIFPRSDAQPIFAAVASQDRTFIEMAEARHYFEPVPGDTGAPDVERLMDTLIPWIRERFDLSPRASIGRAAPERHPAAASFRFPPPDRAPLPGGLRRTNLRELAARPSRFEHHLTIVATLGPAQLEFAVASEPTYFAHHNVCDEYAIALPTGDAMVDAAPLRTFLSDPATFEDVGRYNHHAGDLVRHPSGLLHWPGRLRPPYLPFQFPPGMRRTNVVLIYCATGPLAPGPVESFVSAGRDADAKAYGSSPVGFVLADTLRDAPRTLARIGDTTLDLLVSPDTLAAPRGGFVVVLEAAANSLHFAGDLLFVPPGAAVPTEGLARALWLTSKDAPPDPPPATWREAPAAPFPVFEETHQREPLPVEAHGLVIEERSPAAVTVRIGDARSAEIPRYWLARLLYRVALHGYRIGYLETYGGFFYDDRGSFRVGARGAGHVTIPEEAVRPLVERLYRAVAPEGYTELLV